MIKDECTKKYDPGIQYAIRLNDYLYLNQKLVWYLERWSEKEIKVLNEENLLQNKKIHGAIICLSEGRIDEFLKLSAEGASLSFIQHRKRDEHIGQNMTRAEEDLRGAYAQLRSKDKINMVMTLGWLHNAQKYTKLENIKVIDLSGKSETDKAVNEVNGRILKKKTR